MNQLSLIKFYYIQDLNFLYKSHYNRKQMVVRLIIGTLRSYDATATRTSKKKRINNFLYISLPFIMLHDYDVKLPNFTFYGGRKQENQETRKSKPRYCSL